MDPRLDDRAVAVPLAAILAIGFLLVAAGIYQVEVVPAETAEAEYEHSADVRQSFAGLADAIDRSATGGTTEPAGVPLGPEYPSRTFFVGPPPAAGQLETVDLGTMRVENASYRWPENPEFDGTDAVEREYETVGVRYDPDYAEYPVGATTWLEHGVAVRRSPSGSGTRLGGPGFVDGSTLSLTALGGSTSRSGGGSSGSATLPNRPASVDETTTVEVASDGSGNLTLAVPTRLDESTWNRLLREELSENGGNVTDITVVEGGDSDLLRVELAPGTYDLSLSRVAVGGGAAEPEPEYLYPVTQNQSVRADSTVPVSIEVRDGYDNRVSGVDVTVSVEGENRTITTDENGVATYEYTPSEPGTETLVASAEGSAASDLDPVAIEFRVVS